MDQHFDVVFFGTSATGTERSRVMADVQRLLKLDDAKTEQLFSATQGTLLTTTHDRDKANAIVKAITRVGGSCNYRVSGEEDEWQDWELEEQKAAAVVNRFRCLACEFEIVLPPEQKPPEVCPECGVVQSKYEAVAAQKAEKDKIRRSLLITREMQEKRDEEEQERRRLEKLRKEVEEELRRELKAQQGKRSYLPIVGTAAATFVLGIAGAVAYLTAIAPLDETIAADAATEETAVEQTSSTAAQAVEIANRVVGFAGGTPSVTAQPAAMPHFTATGLPQLTAPPPVGQLPPISADQVAGAVDASVTGPATESTPDFYAALANEPMMDVRMQHEVGRHLQHGKVESANQIQAIARSPMLKVGMQSQIAQALPPTANSTPTVHSMQHSISSMTSLEEKAFGVLALQTVEEPGLGDTAEQDLGALFAPASAGTLDRLKAEALIAATRAKQGNQDASQHWFQAANETLLAIPDPVEQLFALPVLAHRYAEANDSNTAATLLGWTREGLKPMPPSSERDAIAESVAGTYAAMGDMDEAARTIYHFFDGLAERDLRLTRLARDAALQGHVLASQGLLMMIDSNAQRAVARAQISMIAAYDGDKTTARLLSERAREESADLPSPQRQVVASELLRAEGAGGLKPDSEISMAVTRLSDGNAGVEDHAKVVIAKNLAWVGHGDAAERMTASIADRGQRQKTQALVSNIDKFFAAAEVPTAAGMPARLSELTQ